MYVNPTITKESPKTLKFSFDGELTGEQAKHAVISWQQAFAQSPVSRFTLIWDCRHMNGYEPIARVTWQKAMKAMKSQIKTIWLISDKRIVRGGATLMSMMTGIDIKAVATEEQMMARGANPYAMAV